MANNLELKLVLTGDGKQLKAVTQDAKGNIRTLGKVSVQTGGRIQGAMRTAGKSVVGLSKNFAQSLVTLTKWSGVAGGLAATSLAAMVANSNRSIDALAKMADKIGVSTEALASLQHAADLTGVSTETMNMALQRMTRRISEAANGTGEAKDAIKELGLDAQALNDMGPDKAFIAISQAMGNVKNQSDKVRLAMKLFDSEGVALVNTMNLGAEGLNQAAKEADQFGLAISRVDAAKIEAANDAMTRVSAVFKGFSNNVAVEMAPIIEALANKFKNTAIEAGGFERVAVTMVDHVATGIGVMADGLHGIEIIFKGLEVVASSFGVFVTHIFRSLDHAAVNLLNLLPGVSLQYSTTLDSMRESFIKNTGQSFDELQAKLMEPLPSVQIEAWLEKVRADTEVANTQSAQQLLAHEKTITDITTAAKKKELSGLEQFTRKKLKVENDSYKRQREALQVALDNKLITREQYDRRIERAEQQHQRNLESIEKTSAQSYINSLLGVEQTASAVSQRIAADMAGAAGSMAQSFGNAAAQAQQAMNNIQVTQPQTINQDFFTGSGDNNSPFYDGRNRRVIGYSNSGGFGVNVPIFNEPRVRSTGGGLPTTYFHSGGIVGKDLSNREVQTTLRKDEGVFTENQMAALAPISTVERAIKSLAKNSSTTSDANQKMDDFLAEYARINAKHVENFEIAAIRFNDRFAETIKTIPQPTQPPAITTQSAGVTARPQSAINFNALTYTGGAAAPVTGQPSQSVNNLSAEQRYKLMLEYLGLPDGTKTAIYTRDNSGRLKQEVGGGVINATSTQKRVVGNKVIGEFKGGIGIGDGFTRQEGFFVDPAKLEAFFAKKTGQTIGSDFTQKLESDIAQLTKSLQTVKQRNQSGRRSESDIEKIKSLTQQIESNKSILKELADAQQKAQNNNATTAQAQPANAPFFGGLTPNQNITQPQSTVQLYGGLQPLKNFVKENDNAQQNIRTTATETAQKIQRENKTLWTGAGKAVDEYKQNFRATMTNIADIYKSAAQEIEQNPINIGIEQPGQQPTKSRPGQTQTGQTQPQQNPSGRRGQPGWHWDPAREEWVFETGGFFHSGGIVGKDKSSREVSATLYQGEGVFTPNQMASLAPINSIIPILKSIGQGNKVDVHVHEAPNTQTQVQQTQQPDGSLRIDVIAKAVESRLESQIRQGTGIGRTLKNQYGLRRAV